MNRKYLTTFAMLAIAFSPLFVMKAASLTELSQNYRPTLPGINANSNASVDIGAEANLEADDTDQSSVNTSINSSLSERLQINRKDLNNEENRSAAIEFRNVLNSRISSQVPNIPNTGDSAAGASATSTGMINARANANERAFEVASDNSILLRAGEVRTEEDLRAFGLSAIDEDRNLNSISFDNDDIVVGYRGQGRFIGLLPVFLNVDVRVDEEGEIEFDYPWYGFLVTKDTDALEAEIKAEVEALISERAEGGLTNADRAELAAAIVQVLRANYELSTATSTPEVED